MLLTHLAHALEVAPDLAVEIVETVVVALLVVAATVVVLMVVVVVRLNSLCRAGAVIRLRPGWKILKVKITYSFKLTMLQFKDAYWLRCPKIS